MGEAIADMLMPSTKRVDVSAKATYNRGVSLRKACLKAERRAMLIARLTQEAEDKVRDEMEAEARNNGTEICKDTLRKRLIEAERNVIMQVETHDGD